MSDPSMNTSRRVMAVAILASFVAFLDGSVVNVALPAMARDLGGGLVVEQWIVDAYLLTLGALILVAGSISDVFGRIPVLRFGLVTFGVGSLAAAAARTGALLIGARAVQGVGAAFLVPSSLALINSTFGHDEQPKAIGRWMAWTGTAFVAGPLLGGLAVDYLSWRWIFVLSALPGVITFALTRSLLAEVRTDHRAPIDVAGATLAALGLAGTVFALIEQQRLGWGSPFVGIALAVGLACLVLFVWWELRAAHPMLPMTMFAIRNFGWGNLATAFIYAAVSMGMLVVTLFLQEVLGFSATKAGLATLPLPVLSFVLSGVVGGLSSRLGPRVFMSVGPIVAGIGFLLMRPQRDHFDFWTQLLPGLLTFGLGMTITVTPLTSAILAAAPSSQSGVASAVNNAVSRITGLIAIAFTGAIAGGRLEFSSFERVALVTATLFFAGGVVSAVGIRNPTMET